MINIDYNTLTQIKQINLPELLQEKGISLKHNGNGSYIGLCPFHKDLNPSLHISYKNNKWLWHCFGCNKSGTVIDFIELLDKRPFKDTYTYLTGLIDTKESTPTKDLLNNIANLYHRNLKESKEAQAYLSKRGLLDTELIDSFLIGYSNGNIKDILPQDNTIKDALKGIGILNPKENESYYNCITIPIFDKNDVVVGLYGRRINDYEPRHLYLKGEHKGVFNYKAVKAYERIILTEAIIDALSLYRYGFKNVISSYGVEGFTQLHLNLLKDHNVKEVYIAYDNDESSKSR